MLLLLLLLLLRGKRSVRQLCPPWSEELGMLAGIGKLIFCSHIRKSLYCLSAVRLTRRKLSSSRFGNCCSTHVHARNYELLNFFLKKSANRHEFGFGGILGSASRAEFPVSPSNHASRLDCSTAALATPQKVLSI